VVFDGAFNDALVDLDEAVDGAVVPLVSLDVQFA
jgi:hypothetical protein